MEIEWSDPTGVPRLVEQDLLCHKLVVVACVLECQPHLGLNGNLNVHHLDVAAILLHTLNPAGQTMGGLDCPLLHGRLQASYLFFKMRDWE